MPLYKIGRSYYGGAERPIYLLQGNATRDGEWAPVNDKDHGKVSVAAAQTEAGDTVFVTVNGWREKAMDVADVRKMDSVLAIGTLKVREYNGKKYYDLDADFICLSGVSGGGERGSNAPQYPSTDAAPQFAEMDEEPGELPF